MLRITGVRGLGKHHRRVSLVFLLDVLFSSQYNLALPIMVIDKGSEGEIGDFLAGQQANPVCHRRLISNAKIAPLPLKTICRS